MIPEPVTSFATSFAAGKGADLVWGDVVARWSKYRARKFVEQFIESVSQDLPDEPDSDLLEEKLREIVEDEEKSAALFGAYRHVMLSASREIGPRVIALHMAEAIDGRVNDPEVSDAVINAASTLLDFEFEEFLGFCATHGMEELSFTDSLRTTTGVQLSIIEFDSNVRGIRQESGPVPLRHEVGSWALKLERVGLVIQDLSEKEVDYEGDHYSDEPGTVRRIYRYLELREGVSHLYRLVRQVIKVRKDATDEDA